MEVNQPSSLPSPERAPVAVRGILSSVRSSSLATLVSLYGVLHGTAEPVQAQEHRPTAVATPSSKQPDFRQRMRDDALRPEVLNMNDRELEEHVRQLMLWLNEDTFREREAGSAFLTQDLRRLIAHVNPLPSGVLAIMAKGNAEQLARTENVRKELQNINEEQEARLGISGTFPASEILDRWNDRLGYALPVDERLRLALNAPIRIRQDDTYTMTIAAVCQAIGAIPTNDVGLVPAPEHTVTTASRRLLGVVATANDGTKTMCVLYEPGRGMIAASQPHTYDDETDHWTGGAPTIVLQPNTEAPAFLDTGIAYAPVTRTVEVGSMKTIEFQFFNVSGLAQRDHYRTSIDISRNDCTPYQDPSEMKTRPIFDAGRYEPIDAHGTTLPLLGRESAPFLVSRAVDDDDPPPVPEDIVAPPASQYIPDPHGRTVVTFITVKPPAAVRVTVWSKYKEETLRLPPFTPPAPDR